MKILMGEKRENRAVSDEHFHYLHIYKGVLGKLLQIEYKRVLLHKVRRNIHPFKEPSICYLIKILTLLDPNL